MAGTPSTFSESWYRIANQCVTLRPQVKVRRQYFRGERWYVLDDPFNNQFFRLRPQAYEFVARLTKNRTIEEVWKECLDLNPEEAPGQEEVIQLLAQLYSANLLHSDLPPDSSKLFERYKQRRERETKSTWLNIMFARFPLLDPDNFLKRTMPVASKLISPIGAVIWFAVLGGAIKVILDNFSSLKDQTQAVLAPSNLFLLYTGLVIIKALHEFGHAYACRRYGGEVHVMGIMLLIFTPIPYVDTTSSWAFRSRWQRAFVDSAGMIMELFVAACATLIWAKTGPGPLNSLMYNIIFIASVSTLLFNGNPLLRYDGYYILSDILEIPNLSSRATQQLIHLFEYYALGCKKSKSPAHSRKEAWWLAFYGVTSTIYRVFVFSAILLFVADRFLIIGILMAVACAISWLVTPIVKLVRYLATSPKLERTRGRAIAVCSGIAVIILILLSVIPFPNHFRAPGVLEAMENTIIVNESDGYVASILTPSGEEVVKGQALLRLRNRELELQLIATQAEYEETKAMRLNALQQQIADLKPLDHRLVAIEKRLNRLGQQQESLIVRSQHGGYWNAPTVEDRVGSWIPRGTSLGIVINTGSFYFSSIISQQEAARLFADEIHGAQVRFFGQANIGVPVLNQVIIPADRQTLPSAALGWRGGGDVAVQPTDASGMQASEPFFELRATIQSDTEAKICHGRSGKIRFDLDSEPLLSQWIRKLRQLLQKRYSL